MLQVGDQVVYPMHGAGVIADIEQCEVMGEVKSYYVLKMPIGSMKVMIPTDNVENIGLRDVISKKGVKKVAEVLADTPERAVGSWNKRFHATLARMKSGDICDVAAVARNLILQDRVRKISSGERWPNRYWSASSSMPAAKSRKRSPHGWTGFWKRTVLTDKMRINF